MIQDYSKYVSDGILIYTGPKMTITINYRKKTMRIQTDFMDRTAPLDDLYQLAKRMGVVFSDAF